MSLSSTFFSGWLGYGSAFQSTQLVEPTDQSYSRRPVLYGPLDGTRAIDISAGSIGPAGVSWQNLVLVGLFDAVTGGNLLAVIPLDRPISAEIGVTLTDYRRFNFRLSTAVDDSPETATSWVAGAELGRTTAGRRVLAGCNVQISCGSLSAIGTPPTGLSLSALPSVAPATGSGLLWNNGGVICIA